MPAPKNRKPMSETRLAGKITFFLNAHKSTFTKLQGKLSSFYEMKIYNDVVRGYEELGYKAIPENLFNTNTFKYKNSTNGYIANFSRFKISKNQSDYWVIHNLRCECKNYADSYVTADICIVDANSISRKIIDNKPIDYAPNANLKTFFECKLMDPFPELIASFVGLITALTPDCLNKTSGTEHFAPSLVCANFGSKNSYRFSNAVTSSHSANVFNNMAYRTLKSRIRKHEANLIDDR